MFAERTLRAGADGFVMKSALGQTLLQAVDTVLAGGVYLSPAVSGTLLRRAAGRAGPEAGAPELSAREIEVLRLVASGKGTREIAELLNRSVKTVETHKQALKTKLGAESPTMLVRLCMSWCEQHA
jgi:DNA-binding NarL/FixJ family response regulator